MYYNKSLHAHEFQLTDTCVSVVTAVWPWKGEVHDGSDGSQETPGAHGDETGGWHFCHFL